MYILQIEKYQARLVHLYPISRQPLTTDVQFDKNYQLGNDSILLFESPMTESVWKIVVDSNRRKTFYNQLKPLPEAFNESAKCTFLFY